MVTYTSTDIDAAWQRITATPGATVFAEPVAVAAPPYDGKRTFCCVLPGGARLEICEA